MPHITSELRLTFFLFSDMLNTIVFQGCEMNRALIVFFTFALSAQTAFSHEAAVTKADIALEEKEGGSLPADAVFTDENGRTMNLRDTITKPTIIAPIYLRCTHDCPLLLTELAKTLGKLEWVKPGEDFNVIALSFDETDTPRSAFEKKKNYIAAIGGPFPETAWKFLTGDATNIRKVTDSIGFRFQRDAEGFSHPITLVVVSPRGKIVRYLEGASFLPFEVTMALNEAAEGRVGSSARKALVYCFSYDPLKKSYVFNVLKVTGTAMVLFVASFLAYLLLWGRKKEPRT